MPVEVRARLSGELVCYARSVVYEEWPALEAGTQGDAINPWAAALFRTLRTTDAQSRTPSSRPTTSGSTTRRTARRRAGTAFTAPSG